MLLLMKCPGLAPLLLYKRLTVLTSSGCNRSTAGCNIVRDMGDGYPGPLPLAMSQTRPLFAIQQLLSETSDPETKLSVQAVHALYVNRTECRELIPVIL